LKNVICAIWSTHLRDLFSSIPIGDFQLYINPLLPEAYRFFGLGFGSSHSVIFRGLNRREEKQNQDADSKVKIFSIDYVIYYRDLLLALSPFEER